MKIKITTTDTPHNPPKPTTFAEWLQASPYRKVELIRAPDGFKATYQFTGLTASSRVVPGIQSGVHESAILAMAGLRDILAAKLNASIPQELGMFAFEVAADPARLDPVEYHAGARSPDAPCSHRFAQVIRGYWRNRLQCPDCGWGRHLEWKDR